MNNIKKLIGIMFICVLCVVCVLTVRHFTEDKYSQLKSDVWHYLSLDMKQTITSNWESASVSTVKLSGVTLQYVEGFPEWKNANKALSTTGEYEALQITFSEADKYITLGPLRVYVDPDTKKVIGFGPRA